MREVIKTAKTVEEATQLAAAELGVSADEACIEVLELPQRKLFRSIPAKVRAYIEDDTPAPKPAAVEKPKPAQRPAPKEKPAAEKAAKPEKPVQPEKEPQAEKAPLPDAKAEAAVPVSEKEPEAQPVEETAAVPIDLEGNEKIRAAVDYLKDVCAKMGAQELTFTAAQQGDAAVISVEGAEAGTLIGHRGEVMEALNYLTSLVANRAGGEYSKISLDINHYRAKRESNLEALARRIGAKVARTGRGHTLEPMNPYERRIIHSTISEMEGVRSESIGEGSNRRVVISCTNPNVRPPRDNRSGRSGTGRSGGRAPRSTDKRESGGRGSRSSAPRAPRTSTPPREFADRPRDPAAAPVVPRRTETVNDGAGLPLYGKIEL